MLNSKPINKIIFLDIETVPQEKSFFDLTVGKQKAFQWKFKKEYAELGLGRAEHYLQEAFESIRIGTTGIPKSDDPKIHLSSKQQKAALETMEADDRAKMESLYNNKASLFAEFGKIVCISIGFIEGNVTDIIPPDVELPLKVLSFADHDEKKLLISFLAKMGSVINKAFDHTHHLCAHNGKVFDFPFIAKRFILNGLPLPAMFDFVDKKPWDLTYFIDTKEVWQFTVRDNATTLSLLCECFDVPTSKDDIDGSQVRGVYYEENDLPRIVKYCEKDIIALATIYLRMKSLPNPLTVI